MSLFQRYFRKSYKWWDNIILRACVLSEISTCIVNRQQQQNVQCNHSNNMSRKKNFPYDINDNVGEHPNRVCCKFTNIVGLIVIFPLVISFNYAFLNLYLPLQCRIYRIDIKRIPHKKSWNNNREYSFLDTISKS